MICPICQTDYSHALKLWQTNGYNTFVVKSDVFTAEMLEQILEFTKMHQLSDIYIDTYQADTTKCKGCIELNIQEKHKQNKLLAKRNDDDFEINEYF